MIDDDKLKSKIEGLKSNLIHGACSSQIAMETCCKEEAYNEVLTVLDSMQEESVSEDTMTIRKEWFEHCKESWYNEGYIDGKYNRDRQFKEPVSEELEEAAERLSTIYAGEGSVDPKREGFAFYVGFKNGANWQKEQDKQWLAKEHKHIFAKGRESMKQQMMKGAVDGLVYAQLATSGKIMIRSNYFKSETLDYLDNVKLIIIKEDKV